MASKSLILIGLLVHLNGATSRVRAIDDQLVDSALSTASSAQLAAAEFITDSSLAVLDAPPQIAALESVSSALPACGNGTVGSGRCPTAGDCCSHDGFCGRTADYHCGVGCRGGACLQMPSTGPRVRPSSQSGISPTTADPGTGTGCQPNITVNQLIAIAGGTSSGCTRLLCTTEYVQALNQALADYAVCKPADQAGFLAQVRKETGHFAVARNAWDLGVGALHVIPVNFEFVVDEMLQRAPALARDLLPKLAKALKPDWLQSVDLVLKAAVAGTSIAAGTILGGSEDAELALLKLAHQIWSTYQPGHDSSVDRLIGDVLIQPEYFWRIGLGWLRSGGQVPGCSASDDLLHITSRCYTASTTTATGRFGQYPTGTSVNSQCQYALVYWPTEQPIFYTTSNDTCYRRLTRCIFGNCREYGAKQREEYLDLAWKVLTA